MSLRTSGAAIMAVKLMKALRETTVSSYTLNKLYTSSLTELAEIHGPEKAAEIMFKRGYEMGHAYLLKLRLQLGKYEVRVKDIAFIGRTAWLLFSGTDPEIEAYESEVGGETVIVLKVMDRSCPWCSEFKYPVMACSYPAGAYEAAGNTFDIIKGVDFYTVARETACRARGDEHCELTFITIPKSVRRERVREEFKELFTQFPMELSIELYRKTFEE